MKTKDKFSKLLLVLSMLLLLSFPSFAQNLVAITSCQIVEDGQVEVAYQLAVEVLGKGRD